MDKKGKMDSLTALVVVLGIVFILLFSYFIFGAKYLGFASLNLASFNEKGGECSNCSLDKGVEIANAHSSLLDKGLLAYWQFNSGKNKLTDSVSGRVLSGEALGKYDSVSFNGKDYLNIGCEAKCSGSPKMSACSLINSREGCSAFGNEGSCVWSDVCSGTLVCENQRDEYACLNVSGCSWGGSNCYGSSQISCNSWNSDKEKCLNFNSHYGSCSWRSPCTGIISCDKFNSDKECSIVSGCMWVNVLTKTSSGYCDGGTSSCSQWDMDRSGCSMLGYHSGQCSWNGACEGWVSCESQSDSNACEAIPGCSADAVFPVSGGGSWSQFAWIRVLGKNNNQTLFGMGDTRETGGGAYLKVDGSGKVYLDLGGKEVYSNVKVADSWHYVGAGFDGKNLIIYVDGKRAGEKKMSLNVKCLGFSVGADREKDNLEGEVDEIKIYNRSLSDSEVLSNYEVGLFRPSAEFISKVYDLGAESAITSVNWNYSSTNANVTLRFRISSDNVRWGEWSREFNIPGTINLDYGRYVQYNLTLRTFDLTETPIFKAINLEYKPKNSALIFVEPSDAGRISKDSIEVEVSSPKKTSKFDISLYVGKKLVDSVNGVDSSASFSGLKEGNYTVKVSSSGFDSISRNIEVSFKGEKIGKIKIPVNETTGEGRIALESQAKVEVKSVEGNPVRGAIKSIVDSLSN